jgi:hypothetical protein
MELAGHHSRPREGLGYRSAIGCPSCPWAKGTEKLSNPIPRASVFLAKFGCRSSALRPLPSAFRLRASALRPSFPPISLQRATFALTIDCPSPIKPAESAALRKRARRHYRNRLLPFRLLSHVLTIIHGPRLRPAFERRINIICQMLMLACQRRRVVAKNSRCRLR